MCNVHHCHCARKGEVGLGCTSSGPICRIGRAISSTCLEVKYKQYAWCAQAPKTQYVVKLVFGAGKENTTAVHLSAEEEEGDHNTKDKTYLLYANKADRSTAAPC